MADYIAAQPETARAALKKVRGAIRKALPQAEETFSYKMPAYKSRGRVVIYFAGWKDHYALYPANARLVAAFKDELASYQIGKGTIRFPFAEPVPVPLIARIAKFLAQDAVRRAKPRSSPKP
ncbi:MAG TPA: DUF1801 domain-containing protein [Rhizomicrobium sp.]|nr:DUF1801 domain-containing protein [Rhizomicrobium sp.]